MKHQYFKSIFLFTVLFLFSIGLSAQNSQSLWSKTTKQKASQSKKTVRKSEPKKATYYQLDLNKLKNILKNAPKRSVNAQPSNLIINFPTAEGRLEAFRIKEASIMHPDLQAQMPNSHTYFGESIENPGTTIRFSVTGQGLHTMTLSTNKGAEFIDPITYGGNKFMAYKKKDLPVLKDNFICEVDEIIKAANNKNDASKLLKNANDGMLRTFRLALAGNIEYSAFHITAAGVGGGTDAEKKTAVMDAMIVTMNRVNGIYERDLSITMEFVPNNKDIIFLSGNDGYTNNNGATMLGQNQSIIDAAIGDGFYDIGHVFSTGGGGVATLGVPCVSGSKARGVTGATTPLGDAYDIDFVAHEIGHQFGANHTFNGVSGNCSGLNREQPNSYEPGSGTTIMAYAGICDVDDIQSNSDAYFHQASLLEILAYITTGDGTCAVQTSANNATPTADAGASYTIPASTPYMLTGSSTDGDGTSSHSFTWEQYDIGAVTGESMPSETTDPGPMVRSFEGTTNPIRYIPRLQDILSLGSVSTTWEKLPTISRDLNFQLTVRDNAMYGQTATDNMVVSTVAGTGPFNVTSQNSDPNLVWLPGNTETITWDKAGTDANGINATNVDILISTDGGFTYTFLETTANDETHDITVPNTPSPNCRVMVKGSGNIFFDINNETFSIGNFVTTCTQYASAANLNLPIPDDNPSGLFHTINIPDSKTIDYIKVNVDITHTYIGDLIITITHPNGTNSSIVWNRECNGGNFDNFDIIFEDGAATVICGNDIIGTFAPSSLLNTFSGLDSAGDWEIEITDNAPADTGTLTDWYIEVCESTLETKDFGEFTSFSLFPNPNKGEFTVKLNSGSNNNIKVDVYDIRGRSIYNNTYRNTGQFNQSIQLNHAQSGMYILKVSDGERSTTKKIIIK